MPSSHLCFSPYIALKHFPWESVYQMFLSLCVPRCPSQRHVNLSIPRILPSSVFCCHYQLVTGFQALFSPDSPFVATATAWKLSYRVAWQVPGEGMLRECPGCCGITKEGLNSGKGAGIESQTSWKNATSTEFWRFHWSQPGTELGRVFGAREQYEQRPRGEQELGGLKRIRMTGSWGWNS